MQSCGTAELSCHRAVLPLLCRAMLRCEHLGLHCNITLPCCLPCLPASTHLPPRASPACLLARLQVERLAQTEPVEVELPTVLRRLLAGIPQAVRSLGRYSARLGEEVGGRTRSAEDARKRRPDRCDASQTGMLPLGGCCEYCGGSLLQCPHYLRGWGIAVRFRSARFRARLSYLLAPHGCLQEVLGGAVA
jgi:hypothetical protein